MLSGPVRTCHFPVRPPGCGLPVRAQSPPPAPQQTFFWGWAKIDTDKPSHKNTPTTVTLAPPKDIQNCIHTCHPMKDTRADTRATQHTWQSVQAHRRVPHSTSRATVTNTRHKTQLHAPTAQPWTRVWHAHRGPGPQPRSTDVHGRT